MSLTDAAGKTKERYEFDEFGMPLEESFAVTSQPFAFAGYQMDAVGGMYFAQARRYDASAGRFISEDKVRGFIVAPFTLNHYGYCWNRPVDMVDLDGRWPSWDDVKDWWNTNVYGEETVISTTTGEVDDAGAGIYAGQTIDETIPSETCTGGIIKKVTTVQADGSTSVQYSINLPSIDLGDGNKLGVPASLGITFGGDGFSIDAGVGIDIGKLSLNVPASVGFDLKDIVSADLGINIGWDKDSVGLDASLGLNPFSNLKIGGNHTHTDGNTSVTNKGGLYVRTGYVYAIAVAAYGLYGIFTGTMDPSTAWNTLVQYLNSLVTNGYCPLVTNGQYPLAA